MTGFLNLFGRVLGLGAGCDHFNSRTSCVDLIRKRPGIHYTPDREKYREYTVQGDSLVIFLMRSLSFLNWVRFRHRRQNLSHPDVPSLIQAMQNG